MVLTRRDMLATSFMVAAAFMGGCAKRPEPVLRIGTAVWPGYEPLFQARELGYLADNIQLVEYPGTPEIIRSFQNHAIEAATTTLDEVLHLAQVQSDIRVIMAIDFSNGSDALICKPEIGSLQDLRGKRIGVELNSLGAFILSRILEQAGLTLADVEIISVTAASGESVYRNDEVDALICYEPCVSRLQATGAKALFDSSQMPGEIVDVLVVREETIRQHPETLLNLLNGWFRAITVFSVKPDTVLAQAAEHHGITKEDFLAGMERIELLNRERNLAMFEMPNGALPNTIRKLSAAMQKYHLLEKMVDPAMLLDVSVLKQTS